MKERLFNVLKWFLIALGVLFLIQMLIMTGVFIGIRNFTEPNITSASNNKNLKDMQPIINYVENYMEKNNKYPQSIQNVKIKPDLYFKYEVNKDGNCYTITTNSKKDTISKQYQHCSIQDGNSKSSSESYIEFNKKVVENP